MCVANVCYCAAWSKLNSHRYVPGRPQTFMSSAQLWCWPSARPQYLPLAHRLKGPKHPPPALLPADPKDSHRCTWYASQTSPSLSSGKGIGAKIWIENTTLFVRIGMSPGIRAYRGYDVSVSARCKRLRYRQSSIGSSVTGDRYRWTLHPGEQCKSMIVSRMENFRCSRVATSRKTWTAFINMAPIYSEPSLESQTLGTAVSGDKWLLLNGVVPRCCASPSVSLSPNFISSNKVLLFATALSLSIRSLDIINRWYRNVRILCVCMCTPGKWKSFCNG